MAVVESQDDRKAWAGKDLQRSSSAALLRGQGHLQPTRLFLEWGSQQ